MIRLHSDCLIFKTSTGENVPCVAYLVIEELVGVNCLDPGLIREATDSIVHYFRDELGRELVSVQEFSSELHRILTDLGCVVTTDSEEEQSFS